MRLFDVESLMSGLFSMNKFNNVNNKTFNEINNNTMNTVRQEEWSVD